MMQTEQILDHSRRYFTVFWQQDSAENNLNWRDKRIVCTAGTGFRKKGIRSGDVLYIVTLRRGKLALYARFVVDHILTRKQAVRVFKTKNLWPADEWPIAVPGSGTIKTLDCMVPTPTATKLRFKTKSGESKLKFVSTHQLDRQTLRRIRELTPTSAAIFDNIIGSSPNEEASISPTVDDDAFDDEGTIRERLYRSRKRSHKLRELKKTRVMESNGGKLICEVPNCGFDFQAVYGDLGKGYAHVHHKRPLAARRRTTKTSLSDLAIVCANCHAMIHRNGGSRSLKDLISKQTK